MAILKTTKQQIEVPDGQPVLEFAKQIGVPFGCHAGMCGTCQVEVVTGMENLNERTEEEQMAGLQGAERRMCQCIIKNGEVTIQCEGVD